ncbi:MAG: DUF1929 domain-containing protein [Planctomycetes bacterium]|nr:DUF1929 domain-containing protein [Planctomycetota bacterium]
MRSQYGNRIEGMSVLLPGLDRVLILGGRTNDVATSSAEIIDVSAASPAWRYTSPMNFPRADFCATLLPDRTVFVSGGNLGDDASAVYEPELFDPETETWTVLARPTLPRGHHSTAVLLRGGGVLVAGSDGEFRAEVFLPPYVFRGPRPRIVGTPESVAYGESFTVRSPDAAAVGSVVLMRPSATTHWFNPEQRLVDCEFSSLASDRLEVVAPVSANDAPPGYYMLFLLSRDRVPSAAEFVHVGD